MSSNCSACLANCQLIYTSLYSVIMGLGLGLNMAALGVFARLPQLRSPTTVYMRNLAVADLVLAATLPVRVLHYAQGWQPSRWLWELAGCVLLLNMYGSIFLLACISLDRCLAVCFPLSSQPFRRRAPWVCVGVWAFTVGSCVSSYVVGLASRNSSNASCLDNRPPLVTMMAPTVGALVLGFLAPLGIMAAGSWALVRAVGRSRSAQEGMVNRGKILRMLTANVAIFLLCFLPYHTVLLLYQLLNNTSGLNEAYKMALLAACCNTVLDPLAYYFATETFKTTWTGERQRLAMGSEASMERVKGPPPHWSLRGDGREGQGKDAWVGV
ncbi:lysophosphatidic acid receptor 6-like [Ascaphus truei]|uniref:lysophosphatidic acid receptor 6-like n=1 Tax=Ascaphus truei TaxID=8439 RepID=UPI003F5A4EF5